VDPQRLGSRYLLQDRIGQGAMGVVWRGRDLETGEQVAIKFVRPEFATNPASIARFVGERNALMRFRHPNVVNLRDMIVEGERLALVMDLVSGGDLDAFRQRNGGALAAGLAASITAQICDGLAAAHAAGIIHRDLKPSNVLLEGGQVRLADFGIARIVGESKSTSVGMVMGTAAYLAPELIDGADPTPACDIYSAGITLYELIAGHAPFSGHVAAIMQAHLQKTAERPAGVPDRLWELISACLSKDPAARPTAEGLGYALDGIGGGNRLEIAALSRPPKTGPPRDDLDWGMPTSPGQSTGLHPLPARTPDARTPDAGTPDARAPDAGTPDARTPDAAGNRRGATRARRRRPAWITTGALALVAAAVASYLAFGLTKTESPGHAQAALRNATAADQSSSPSRGNARHPHSTATGSQSAAADPNAPATPSERPSGHASTKPTRSPSPGHPSSSASASPSRSPTPSKSPSSAPAADTAWQCGPAVDVTIRKTGNPSGQTLQGCIRVSGGQVEVQGTLSGVKLAWSEQIRLALRDGATGAAQVWISPVCQATTCVFTASANPGAGTWYVEPGWLRFGNFQSPGSPSPSVQFGG
jgi:serine/threonine-protein kinase